MKKICAIALLSIAFFTGVAAIASAGPDVIKPYYYLGTGRTLSATDQQNLEIYRDQLEAQQRAQQLQTYQGNVTVPNSSGPLRPLGNGATAGGNLNQTQSELGRVNSLLNTSHTP